MKGLTRIIETLFLRNTTLVFNIIWSCDATNTTAPLIRLYYLFSYKVGILLFPKVKDFHHCIGLELIAFE